MQANFSARHELEMFDRAGNVDLLAVDAGLDQGTIEHLPRRSDERLSGEIFLVAGLLADQHNSRVRRTFAKHGLRRILPERAGAAMSGLFTQDLEVGRRCHERFSPSPRV